MFRPACYTCHAVLLPVIEGAFAANGYTVETTPHRGSSDGTLLVLQRGVTTVLLTQLPDDSVGEIQVWGPGQSAVARLLESLPIEVHRQHEAWTVDADG